MSRIRELVSDTLVYGFTTVISRLLTYLLVPFYTKFFGPGDYGIITLVFIAIGFFNVLFTFGMESAYLRYGVDRDRAASIFKTLQLTILAVATSLFFILWLVSPWLQPLLALPDTSNDPIYLLMLVILWMDALSTVPFAELRLVRRTIAYASAKLMNVGINVVLNLVLVLYFDYGIIAVFIANMAASAFTLLLTAWITRNSYKGSWDQDSLREAMLFGLPYIPAGIGYIINEGLSRFFLNMTSAETITRLYGMEVTAADITGIFGACYKLSVFMMLFTQMFRMAWQPFFMRHAKEASAPKTFADVFLYFNGIAAILFMSVALFVHEIAAIPVPGLRGTIIDSRYWLGLSTVPMLLVAYWFQGWYTNFTAGIFISEQTRLLPRITLAGAAITTVANLILIPVMGMEGAAWASVLSYGSMAMMMYFVVQKKWPIPYIMWKAWASIIIGALAVFASLQFPSLSSMTARAIILVGASVLVALITFSQKRD